MSDIKKTLTPRVVRMHPADNVAIVVNDGGLTAGTVLTRAWCCVTKCRRATK